MKVAAAAADVFFVSFAPVPLCFAGPVDLAVFAAMQFFIRRVFHKAAVSDISATIGLLIKSIHLFIADVKGLTLNRYLL